MVRPRVHAHGKMYMYACCDQGTFLSSSSLLLLHDDDLVVLYGPSLLESYMVCTPGCNPHPVKRE